MPSFLHCAHLDLFRLSGVPSSAPIMPRGVEKAFRQVGSIAQPVLVHLTMSKVILSFVLTVRSGASGVKESDFRCCT